jgi:hypothetical protein
MSSYVWWEIWDVDNKHHYYAKNLKEFCRLYEIAYRPFYRHINDTWVMSKPFDGKWFGMRAKDIVCDFLNTHFYSNKSVDNGRYTNWSTQNRLKHINYPFNERITIINLKNMVSEPAKIRKSVKQRKVDKQVNKFLGSNDDIWMI